MTKIEFFCSAFALLEYFLYLCTNITNCGILQSYEKKLL